MADWLNAHQTFAVWGAGRSGIAASNLLAAAGKRVILSDSRPLDEPLANLHPDVEVRGGGNTFQGCELIVASPGLKPSLSIFADAKRAGVPVISEIELAYDVCPCRITAITGTDGKTTTTSLIGAIHEQANHHTIVAGNIGTPLCEIIATASPETELIAEVSAFQLWSTRDFRPRFACLTNLADDHLDYFLGDVDAYVQAKRDLIKNMQAGDWLWLNGHDERARAWADDFPGEVGFFGLSEEATRGGRAATFARDGALYYRVDDGPALRWCEDTSELGLSGPHNILNMTCAAGITRSQGIDLETILAALRGFKGLPHRFELIGEISQIRYIDDSKATNAHAAMAGLNGLEEPFVAIVGGVDKGLDLGPLCELLASKARAVISIGELRQRLKTELLAVGLPPTQLREAESMREAVELAHGSAKAGESVVLSPACSSFDMFDSYAHRGRVFQEEVARLRARV